MTSEPLEVISILIQANFVQQLMFIAQTIL